MAKQAEIEIQIIENRETRIEPINNLKEQYRHWDTTLFFGEIGDSFFKLDKGELHLSSETLGFKLLINLVLFLTHVLHIKFDVDHDTHNWYCVCYYTLLIKIGSTSIDLYFEKYMHH